MATTPISTRGEWIAALRDNLQQALAEGVPLLRWSDVDFADWPLNEPALIEALTRWTRPHHRLVLLAQHYGELQRRHPRFVQWRRTWGHLVEPRSPTELLASDHPSLLLAGRRTVELVDRDHWRGQVSDEPADAQRCREALDVILQRSEPAFAATTLGL
ncbi:hypothetical protein [Ideonella sp. BN130291]|uniref:hypothetical protein n=1 Tax=Ideonella sp. BN130291 TaxID=3112940 RepID=UPI002E25ED4D|nr:hypothetical protein [Ideonella sp. BN130291]